MKKVHDIVRIIVPGAKIALNVEDAKDRHFPIAFIQWGNRDDGFQYEVVCPFCAKSIGWVIPAGPTIGEAVQTMAPAMATHKPQCPRFGEKFGVEIATGPMGTEKLPIM